MHEYGAEKRGRAGDPEEPGARDQVEGSREDGWQRLEEETKEEKGRAYLRRAAAAAS